MSRFVTDKNIRISLGGNEWVDVHGQLTFAELSPIMSTIDSANPTANLKMAIPLLELAITDWCLENDDATTVPFDKDKIKQLDTATVVELFPKIIQLYFPEKKSSTTSAE